MRGTLALCRQGGTSLSAVVVQIGKPQSGNNRLTGVIEEIFDSRRLHGSPTCGGGMEALVARVVEEADGAGTDIGYSAATCSPAASST